DSHDLARDASAGRLHRRRDRPADEGRRAQFRVLNAGAAHRLESAEALRGSDAMQKMISADRLARPDNFVLMRARRMREIREEQGLDDRVLPFDEEALRVRLHGIFAGELQAMEAAGRTLFDFPDA